MKTEQPEHLRAILQILKDHEDWLTTATRTADIHTRSPLRVRPILVLTGQSDAQQRIFYDELLPGDRVLVFGAVHTVKTNPMAPPEILESERAKDLRDLRTKVTERERIELSGKIKVLIEEDERLRSILRTTPEKKVEDLGKENDALQKQLPVATTQAEMQAQDQLIGLRKQLLVLQSSVATQMQMLLRIDQLPSFSYISGSLEDAKVIRERVCNILEGGPNAFLEREKRYALQREERKSGFRQ